MFNSFPTFYPLEARCTSQSCDNQPKTISRCFQISPEGKNHSQKRITNLIMDIWLPTLPLPAVWSRPCNFTSLDNNFNICRIFYMSSLFTKSFLFSRISAFQWAQCRFSSTPLQCIYTPYSLPRFYPKLNFLSHWHGFASFSQNCINMYSIDTRWILDNKWISQIIKYWINGWTNEIIYQ